MVDEPVAPWHKRGGDPLGIPRTRARRPASRAAEILGHAFARPPRPPDGQSNADSHARSLRAQSPGPGAGRASRHLGGPAATSSGLAAVAASAVDRDLDAYLAALAGAAPAPPAWSCAIAWPTTFSPPSSCRRTTRARSRRRSAAVRLTPTSTSAVRHELARSGTKNDVEHVWVVWAECDGAEASRAACSWEPAPSIVIRSGSGPNVHAYWPLREPLTPREAEAANLRLAHALGADRACFDAARILRPPGTWNHKHRPPALVTPLRMEAGIAFDAAEIVAHAPEVDRSRIERRWTERSERDPAGDPLLTIPPAIYVSALLGVGSRPGRKVAVPFTPMRDPAFTSTQRRGAGGPASPAGAAARSTTSPPSYGGWAPAAATSSSSAAA